MAELAKSRKPGSSPLTRGAHEDAALLALAAGLIPAHAGSTGELAVVYRTATAHPRSRGEHSMVVEVIQLVGGSSPLTRGARPIRLCLPLRQRLIPAHAGSTTVEAVSW